MNVVGKILAFLVLVLALVIGGFQAIQFVTKTNWKKGYEDVVRDLQAMETSRNAYMDAEKRERDRNDKLKKQMESYQRGDFKISETNTAEVAMWRVKLDQSEQARLKAEIVNKELAVEAKRRTDEAAFLRDAIAKREAMVLDQQKKIDEVTREKLTAEANLQTILGRYDVIVEEMKELRKKYAELQLAGGADAGPRQPVALVKNSKDPNPPQRAVRGEVRRVTEDGLVSVDVGLDAGVKEGHTLEVFRLEPRAEYLGMLRIEKSFAHEAIGRLVRLGNTTKVLRMGDRVSDSIDARR